MQIDLFAPLVAGPVLAGVPAPPSGDGAAPPDVLQRLIRDGVTAYCRTFRSVFGFVPEGCDDDREEWPGAVDDLLYDVRRKTPTDQRIPQ